MALGSDLRRRVSDDRVSIAVCLLIALAAWLVLKLSKEYNHTIRFAVSYETPTELAFDQLPPTSLTAQLRAKGWTFLNMSLGQRKDTIRIPVIASGAMAVLPVIQERLPEDLSERITILSITPMQLDLRMSEKTSKKVPIQIAEDLQPAAQYQYRGPVLLQPDSVTVFGTHRSIGDINSWKTMPFGSAPLKEDFEGEVELQEAADGLVSIDVKNTVIKIRVEQVTEKQIYVPITLSDSLKKTTQIFPDQALVKCTVGLSRFEEVATDAFRVQALPDPSLGKREWRVDVTKVPDFVTLLDYSPKTVEFFLINP